VVNTYYPHVIVKGDDLLAYTLHTELAHSSNHGATRNASDIKYIVIHYTANKNDSAKSNANYFKTANRRASANYFVDSMSVYQSVKDNVIAWSVGGSKYSDCKETGGGKLYGKVTNTNSISIELCSTNGAFAVDTLTNAALLIKKLMKKYNIGIDNIVRHFDCTGKHCPAYWMGSKENEDNFISFRNRIIGKTVATASTSNVPRMKVKTSGGNLNCHETKDLNSQVIGLFKNNKTVKVMDKTSCTIYKVKATDIDGNKIAGYVASKYLV